jgi:hypothetical protein
LALVNSLQTFVCEVFALSGQVVLLHFVLNSSHHFAATQRQNTAQVQLRVHFRKVLKYLLGGYLDSKQDLGPCVTRHSLSSTRRLLIHGKVPSSAFANSVQVDMIHMRDTAKRTHAF